MSCCGSMTPYIGNISRQFPSQMPALPTGIPTGPFQSQIPQNVGTPTTIGGTPAPQTIMSNQYIPGYLRTQIGKKVRVEFLIGTNGPLVDRVGTLLGVGASYILIRPQDSDDLLMADLYSIKFVTTYG